MSGKSGDNVTRDPASVNEVPWSGGAQATGKKHLIKAAAIVGLMTLVGRVLGLFRDIVSAKTFGTRWQWDAFVYAFMLPNLFRRIVVEGGLTSAFIPVYNEIAEKQGRAEATRFANITMTFLFCVLLVVVLLVEAGLTLLLKIGFQSAMVMLTLELTRLLFPYLLFLSLYALGMGVLNSHRHFWVPALGSAVLDFVWICAVLWVPSWMGHDYFGRVRWLSWALFAMGFFYILMEIPPLLKIGFRFKWIWDVSYGGLKKAWALLPPVVLSFAVVQINMTVGMALGGLLGPGANSTLWYGNRLMQFPLGIFALAMGTALLPMLAQQIARGEKEASCKTLSFALRSIFFIILPSSVGLIVLRGPIVRMLFERGEFDAASTARSAAVLLGYTIGLFAFAGHKIMNSGYYAAQDSRTPMKTSIIALVTNLVLSLALMIPFREGGLALAASISGIIQFGQLIYYYPKKVGEFPFREIGMSFLRILLASLVMGILSTYSWIFLKAWVPGSGTLVQLIQVLSSILIGIMAYFGFCYVFHVPEMHEAMEWIRGKKSM